MPFQIHALPAEPFVHLFDQTTESLAAQNARIVTATADHGYPCRVSLADAKEGERLVLVNYTHLPEASPYRACHAIYVRETACQARLAEGEVPPMLERRTLSLRGFDSEAMLRQAEVTEGTQLAQRLRAILADERIETVHVHVAGPGCFAARVTRPA